MVTHAAGDVGGYPLEWREGMRWDPGTTIIDDSDGERPAYRVEASCSNCSWSGEIRRQKGYEPRHSYPCPSCGCRAVRSLRRLAGTDSDMVAYCPYAKGVSMTCSCGQCHLNPSVSGSPDSAEPGPKAS